jgi:hypothetical protein
MRTLTYNLYLLIIDKGQEVFSLTELQIDNTITIATANFV